MYVCVGYRSIQDHDRQTFIMRAINSNYSYRIGLPEELVSVTETDRLMLVGSKRIDSAIMSTTAVLLKAMPCQALFLSFRSKASLATHTQCSKESEFHVWGGFCGQ